MRAVFPMRRKVKRESPLKAKPLRQSGQSTDERLRDLIDDDLLGWGVVAMFAIILAGVEWYRWMSEDKFNPVLYTTFAVLLAVYVGQKIFRHLPKLRALKLGRDGEIAVGQYLESTMSLLTSLTWIKS